MLTNSLNGNDEVKLLPSIATNDNKNVTKNKNANKGDFLNFFDKLGKTDKTSNNAENPKNNQKINNSSVLKPQKEQIVKTLLKQEKDANLPIEQVEQTQTKEIQNIKTNTEAKNDIKDNNNKDILNYLLQQKISPESKNNQKKEDIKNLDRKENNINKNIQEVKKLDFVDNLSQNKKSELTNIEPEILNTPLAKNLNIKNINKVKGKPEEAEILKDDKDLAKNQQTQQNLVQTQQNYSMIKDDEIKLPFKETLKYGAFKAFDALSLLKPSDGKKLSDLIKKADELSLNLETIKLQDKKAHLPLNNNLNNLEIKNSDLKKEIDKLKESNLDSKIDIKKENKDEIKNTQINNTNENNQNKDNAHKIQNENNNVFKSVSNNIKDPKDSAQNNQNKDNQNSNEQNAQNAQNFLKESKENNLQPISFKENKNEIKNEDSIKPNLQNSLNVTSVGKLSDNRQTNDIKETIQNFTSRLKQEITNYKPPLSKVTIELSPANLGSIEINITHQGKNIQVQLNANQNTVNLFVQNQSDLRNALNQIGYENVTMSFSNGSQMGFSDNKGNWSFHDENNPKNINTDGSETANLELILINNYA